MDLLMKVAAALGITLAEGASEEAIVEAFKAVLESKPKEKTELSESAIQKLVEGNPQVKMLVDLVKDQKGALEASERRIVTLEAASRLSGINHRLSDWHAGGAKKKFGLPVSLDDKVRGLMLSLNDKQGEAFAEIVTALQETGFVPIGEAPAKRRESESTGDVDAEVEREMAKIIEAAAAKNVTLSEGEALTQLFRENEELYERYRAASYAVEKAEGGEA